MWRICLGAGASASVRVERTRVQPERPEELTTFRPAQGNHGASCYLLWRRSKTGFSRGMHRNCTCEALRFSCGVLLYAAEGTAQSRRHWLLHPGAGSTRRYEASAEPVPALLDISPGQSGQRSGQPYSAKSWYQQSQAYYT
jgi:hypothetical protein